MKASSCDLICKLDVAIRIMPFFEQVKTKISSQSFFMQFLSFRKEFKALGCILTVPDPVPNFFAY